MASKRDKSRLFYRAKSDRMEAYLCRDAAERIELMIKLGKYEDKPAEGYNYSGGEGSSLRRARMLIAHYKARLAELEAK